MLPPIVQDAEKHLEKVARKNRQEKKRANPRQLHELWRDLVGTPDWMPERPELLLLLAQLAHAAEEHLLVCDICQAAERCRIPASAKKGLVLLQLRMLHGRSLMRLGYVREARSRLRPEMVESCEKQHKAEFYHLLAEIAREESHYHEPGLIRQAAQRRALEWYLSSLAQQGRNATTALHLNTLIFTAGMARVLGEEALAATHAGEAIRLAELCERKRKRPDVKTVAARAAAQIILGAHQKAKDLYSTLASLEGATAAQLAEERHYAGLLARAAKLKDERFFEDAFPSLQLLVFAGHMPGSNFPVDQVGRVRQAIRKVLEQGSGQVGFGSAAAGADLLFIDEMQQIGAEVHIVLPWAASHFCAWSVANQLMPPNPETGWKALFDRGLKRAASVRELGHFKPPGNDDEDLTGWRYLSEVTCGLAMLKARELRFDLLPVVVINPEQQSGGAADFKRFWERSMGVKEVLQLPVHGKREAVELQAVSQPKPRAGRGTLRQEVKSMLFADIVGYSQLPESAIPDFIEHFKYQVSELVASSRHSPLEVNTWGDSVYAVFNTTADAACFALELVEMIRQHEEEWIENGLKWVEKQDGHEVERPLSIRVGLHAGPVFLHYDPVVRALGYTGAHVSRAARIEPVTPAGEIYASEEFAALAAVEQAIARCRGEAPRAESFVCENAGSMELAKKYPGYYRIYRVQRARSLHIESLAKSIHESFVREQRIEGKGDPKSDSLREWTRLDEGTRNSNREQARNIPDKLWLIGYELSSVEGLNPRELRLTEEEVERLAEHEHERWRKERVASGWRLGAVRNNQKQLHPSLLPWSDLPPLEKDKNRRIARELFDLVATAGFRLRRVPEENQGSPRDRHGEPRKGRASYQGEKRLV